MAASLTITGFHDSIDYKVVNCTSIEDATVFVNVTESAGTLYAAYINSANCNANVSLHILDGKDQSNSEIIIKGVATEIRSLQIPKGFAFDMLNFRVSANSAEDDTTDFVGTVSVTLICS